MDQTLVTLPVAGAAVGASVTWMVARGRIAAAALRATTEAARTAEALAAELRVETGARAAAEQKALRVAELERELAARVGELQALMAQHASLEARLQAEQQRMDEERELVSQLHVQMEEKFRSLSTRALKESNDQFLTLAKESLEKHQTGAQADLEKRKVAIEQLVKPIADSLKLVERQVVDIEKTRITSHAALLQQVQSLETTASTLATALRAPKTRGRWGEMQLRRVVELAGMVNHCDFVEQAHASSESGRLMPDMVVNLAGGKSIVVDSKVPFDAYLSAAEATDEDVRRSLLEEHAARVRQHVIELSRKEYWKQFEPAPDFVVLFLPGEDLFSAALEIDPGLIDFGARSNVMIATPISLISTLRSVALGWREAALAENARKIRDLGCLLYDRAATVAEKWGQLGKHLGKAVESYNGAVASMETRFLVTAREFPKLEVPADKVVPELAPVEQQVRDFVAAEMTPEAAGDGDAPGLQLAAGASPLETGAVQRAAAAAIAAARTHVEVIEAPPITIATAEAVH